VKLKWSLRSNSSQPPIASTATIIDSGMEFSR